MLARSGLTSAGGLHGTGSARLSQMLAQSDAWTEGALDALSKALVEATIQQASATLQALRLKRDYAPTQSHASNVMKSKRFALIRLLVLACTRCVA
jgi:hypothetical protein